MVQRSNIIRALADGQFHSGEALGRTLGISRAAVWKRVQALAGLGLEVQSVRGRGYRLVGPLELLEPERIRAAVAPERRLGLTGLEVLDEVDSTNRYLLDQARAGAPSGSAVFAERQTAGRGRRGRGWVSPYGRNLYLSLLWRFDEPPLQAGLSLTVGVAAARALETVGLGGVGLKWPNDLVWERRKLGGILLEVMGETSGPTAVVIGIGLNVHMGAQAATAIDQPWVDMTELTGGAVPSRNRIAGVVLDELLGAVATYTQHGFTPFRAEWERRDVVAGYPVELRVQDRAVRGRAIGIDDGGALLVSADGRTERYLSGEVTLRMRES